MWFSAIYQPGESPPHWPKDQRYNLPNIIEAANLAAFRDSLCQGQWEIQQLISTFSAQGLTPAACSGGWILGQQSYSSTESSRSYWEEFHQPPRLKLLGQVKGKSLDELDELMVKFKEDAEQQINKIPQGKVAIIKPLDDKDDASDESDVISDTSSGSVWEP